LLPWLDCPPKSYPMNTSRRRHEVKGMLPRIEEILQSFKGLNRAGSPVLWEVHGVVLL
jgi:hypothetical protein